MVDVVTLTVTATLPVDQPVAFDALVPFDTHLKAAPAVRSVKRHGEGDIGTTYHVELQRYGKRGTIETEVTSLDHPRRLSWQATRPIDGSWTVETSPVGSTIQIEIDIDAELITSIDLGWVVRRLGLERLLRRALARELKPVLTHLVRDVGGNPSAVELGEVQIRMQ